MGKNALQPTRGGDILRTLTVVLSMILVLMLVTYIPQITLLVPNLLGMK